MGAKAKNVQGLSFRVTVEPLMRGEVMANVPPMAFEWNQTFACEWHEQHPEMALQFALKDMRERVRRVTTPVAVRRKR